MQNIFVYFVLNKIGNLYFYNNNIYLTASELSPSCSGYNFCTKCSKRAKVIWFI